MLHAGVKGVSERSELTPCSVYFYNILISYYYYILTEFMPKEIRLTQIISSRGMVINCEKYLRIEISRLIIIAHTHVRILLNHMTYSIS